MHVTDLLRPIPRDLRFRFSRHLWQLALELAAKNGWIPEGTHAPRFQEFGEFDEDEYSRADAGWRQLHADILESYIPSSYQVVSAKDACAIANALERALPSIGEDMKIGDLNFKKKIEDLIRFCRGGEFWIG